VNVGSGTVASFFMNMTVDVSFVAPQVHRIVNVALHRECSPGILFIFF
jgi:hypothetical protein